MRAVVYRPVGAPEVIEVAEIDLPDPRIFEIRIKVDATALSPPPGSARPLAGRPLGQIRERCPDPLAGQIAARFGQPLR